MQEIELKAPYTGNEITPEGMAFVEALKEMERMHVAGEKVYVKYLTGDRKDSIGYFIPDYNIGDTMPNNRITQSIYNADAYIRSGRAMYQGGAHGTIHWEDRPNKIKAFVPHGFAWLKDYDGPTVWKKFDAKAAKEQRLANIDERDIDGNKLELGDKVVYINTRYGSGSALCHGTVIRFDASRDTTWTIVQLDDTDMESKITDSGSYIWKKPVDNSDMIS